MRRKNLLWIGAALLASTGVAFADDPNDPNAPPAGGTPPATAPAPAAAAPGGWLQLNDRPLVLPMGKFEVHGGIPILNVTVTDPMTMMSSSSVFEGLSVGATYGVADKIEAGVDYSFPLHPNGDIGTGDLLLHGAFAAMHNDKMDLAIGAGLNLNVGGSTTLAQITLGGWFRYHVAPKISIFTGQIPVPAVLFPLPGGGSAIGNQLSIGLNNSQPISLALPVGVGIQAAPNVFIFAATEIANIYLSNGPGNSSGAFIFSDFIPVDIGAYFSASDQLDLGVTFVDDLKHAGDAYAFTFGGRYYIK